MRHGIRAGLLLAVVLALAGCSTVATSSVASDTNTAASQRPATVTESVRNGRAMINYQPVTSPRKFADRDVVASGEVTEVRAGPVAIGPADPGEVGVEYYSIVDVEVSESFDGTTKPGQLVSALLYSGQLASPGQDAPSRAEAPEPLVVPLTTLQEVLNPGRRVVIMSDHIEASEILPPKYHVNSPEGLADSAPLLVDAGGLQGFSIEQPDGQMTDWRGYGFDSLTAELRSQG